MYIKKSAEINDISQEVLNFNIKNKNLFSSKCENLPQKCNEVNVLSLTSFQEMYAQKIFQKSTKIYISLYHSLDKGNFFKQLLSILEYIKL